MAYLHSDREQFRDAIDLAYEQTGVMVQAIEKDYYVTMLLRLLAQKIAVVNQINLLRYNINCSYLMMLTQQSCNRQTNITP